MFYTTLLILARFSRIIMTIVVSTKHAPTGYHLQQAVCVMLNNVMFRTINTPNVTWLNRKAGYK